MAQNAVQEGLVATTASAIVAPATLSRTGSITATTTPPDERSMSGVASGQSFTPSMMVQELASPSGALMQDSRSSRLQSAVEGPSSGSLLAMLQLFERMEDRMKDERAEMARKEEMARAVAKAEQTALQAQVEKLLAPPTVVELLSAAQLTALQGRLERMHVAQLLTDDEVCAAEDLCADFWEFQTLVGSVVTRELVHSSPAASCPSYTAARKLATLVGLSEGIAADAQFARQLRRKILVT